MNPHVKKFLSGSLKLLLIAGLVGALICFFHLHEIIPAPDLISGITIGFMLILIAATGAWLLFMMTSSIYKSILGRCWSIEEIILKNEILYLTVYYSHPGADDGPDTGYYRYKIDTRNPKMNLIETTEKISASCIKPDFKTRCKKNKKFDKNDYYIDAGNFSIKATPFKIMYGFDEGYRIEMNRNGKKFWSKKI